MTTVYDDGIVKLIHGDVIEQLRELDENSIDAIVTDPPYGLEFMGKEWDGADGFRRSMNPDDVGRDNVFGRTSAKAPEYRTIPGRGARVQEERAEEMTPTGKGHTGSKGPYLAARVDQFVAGHPYQQWCEVWAEECLRVLKPGGHLLSFGGTRTYHRLACAIEDAGFVIRDCIVWGYMSGFPKSLDVSKAIDKAAGADREDKWEGAFERRAGPTGNRKCDTCGKWLMSSNPCQCPRPQDEAQSDDAKAWQGWGTALKPAWEPIVMARKPLIGTVAANVLEHGTGGLNIDATRIQTQEGEGDPSAERKAHGYTDAAKKALGATVASENETGFSGEVVGMDSSKGRWPANVMLTDPIFDGDFPDDVAGGGSSTSGDSDGYVGPHKAAIYGKYARNQIRPEVVYADTGGKSRFFLVPKADRAERERGLTGDTTDAGMHNGKRRLPDTRERSPHELPQRINTHPTVKPLDLMVHLVRLVTPPGGTVLDPFVGSGTTMLAASEEGYKGIGIDQSADYLKIAEGRLIATPIGMGLSA